MTRNRLAILLVVTVLLTINPAFAQQRASDTEIAEALVTFWALRRSEPELVGLVVKGNAASERVLLKAGFLYERDALFHDQPCGVFRRAR